MIWHLITYNGLYYIKPNQTKPNQKPHILGKRNAIACDVNYQNVTSTFYG